MENELDYSSDNWEEEKRKHRYPMCPQGAQKCGYEVVCGVYVTQVSIYSGSWWIFYCWYLAMRSGLCSRSQYLRHSLSSAMSCLHKNTSFCNGKYPDRSGKEEASVKIFFFKSKDVVDGLWLHKYLLAKQSRSRILHFNFGQFLIAKFQFSVTYKELMAQNSALLNWIE